MKTKEEVIKEFEVLCSSLAFSNDSPSMDTIIEFLDELDKTKDNGWIAFKEKINIEHNSLPLELYNVNTKEHYISFDETEFIEIGRFTHYKIIQLSKPPLY